MFKDFFGTLTNTLYVVLPANSFFSVFLDFCRQWNKDIWKWEKIRTNNKKIYGVENVKKEKRERETRYNNIGAPFFCHFCA